MNLPEAAEEVDTGAIYDKKWFDLYRTDLADDWRNNLSAVTFELGPYYVEDYPVIAIQKREHRGVGEGTYLPKRTLGDSPLGINQTIVQQLDLLRIAGDEQYPEFFEID